MSEFVTELDALDVLAAEVFDGYLVKKDLARKFQGQYPVPTYVGEFMLGRYCATTDPDAIAAGLVLVEESMRDRTVRAGEEELFKHRARERGTIKIIDLIKARLDSAHDAYMAELPSLQLNDIHISPSLIEAHQRMLTGGFYAEVTLEYIAALAGQQGGQPFRVEAIRPIQMSTSDAVGTFIAGRSKFTLDEWRRLLLRSVGFEPERLSQREQDMLIARMIPFVMPNYNFVELGPRGTGKSHLFQQVSPYAHLVSGGRATIPSMFVNNSNGRRGLVAQYDVICFDEISGVSFDSKEGINILKGYMESGEFSRGKESIRAEGGIVMVGNFEVDVFTQLRTGHLLSPMPKEMRDDTAFMDRIHAYIPGWDVPKLDPTYFTEHFGFVSDFIAEAWTKMRASSRLSVAQGRLNWGSSLSGRDLKAVNKTVDGFLRLLYPDPEVEVPDEFLSWAAELALEMRRRVKEAQAFIGAEEFGDTDLSYSLSGGPEKIVYCQESLVGRPVKARLNKGDRLATGTADGAILPAPDPMDPSYRTESRSYSIGEKIKDRFKVERILGKGGFATVYKVWDTVEERDVALKMFRDAAGYEAVRRELDALRRIDHPHVRKVIWVDRTDAGEWFLIMEYIDGELLADFIDGNKPLRDGEAINVALDLLSALVAMHPDTNRLEELKAKESSGLLSLAESDELESITTRSLVHRDIKPNNVLLTRTGAKLLDFNISSNVGDTVQTMSGTPAYQPPDEARTRWDVQVDLFAVGVTLYELLCNGNHPYIGDQPRIDADPVNPLDFRPDLSAGLSEFLMKACAPSRTTRFQSAAEMETALKAVR